jgi:single-strand DNA-binding protein
MASSVNKVILIGNLGKDPEIHYFEENRGVARFTMATTESYKDKSGERQEQTEWHNITIWRPGLVGLAEQYLKKGSKLYVEGKLRTRSWEDDNKNTRYTTEIVVDNLTFLGSASGSGGNERSGSSASAPPQQKPVPANNESSKPSAEEDDLPF